MVWRAFGQGLCAALAAADVGEVCPARGGRGRGRVAGEPSGSCSPLYKPTASQGYKTIRGRRAREYQKSDAPFFVSDHVCGLVPSLAWRRPHLGGTAQTSIVIEAHKLLRVVLSGPATLESLKRLVPVPRSLELMFDPCSEPQYRSEMRSTSVIGQDVRELLNRFTPSTRSRSTITCPAAAVTVSRDRWSASSAVGRDARVQLQGSGLPEA